MQNTWVCYRLLLLLTFNTRHSDLLHSEDPQLFFGRHDFLCFKIETYLHFLPGSLDEIFHTGSVSYTHLDVYKRQI